MSEREPAVRVAPRSHWEWPEVLRLLGFVVLWPVCWLALSIAINFARVKAGAHINDSFSVFMQSMIFPPFAILGSLSPDAQASGKARPMLLGGCVGTVAAILLFRLFA